MVLGIRGMPNIQGGVETHAEQLYPRLAAMGCDIDVLARSPFTPPEQRFFSSIRMHRIWSPRSPGFEALVHSVLGVLYAGLARPHILHIHAIGPAIVTPIARLFGLKVVVTHHGPDYDRDKWGPFARWVLRTGESFGMRFSNDRIAVSQVIHNLVLAKYGRRTHVIPNGAAPAILRSGAHHVARFGLEAGRYFMQVSRIVPEKRQLDLIRAYARVKPAGWKLVLVGSGGQNQYMQAVTDAAKTHGVILTGFQGGVALQELYSHAGAFVLPSSHEGLPIAMLEALSYGLPVIASDIPANLEVGLDRSSYFPVGDVDALASSLTNAVATPNDAEARKNRSRWVAAKYDWESIAKDTLSVYLRVHSA